MKSNYCSANKTAWLSLPFFFVDLFIDSLNICFIDVTQSKRPTSDPCTCVFRIFLHVDVITSRMMRIHRLSSSCEHSSETWNYAAVGELGVKFYNIVLNNRIWFRYISLRHFSGQNVKLTACIYIMPRLRMRGFVYSHLHTSWRFSIYLSTGITYSFSF